MELADAVPLGGVAAEIGLRRGSPRRAHRREPLAVARDSVVGGIEPNDELARELGGAATLAQAKEGPGAFAEALDQTGLGQEPQMARDARLRLAQDVGELGDGQLGLRQERKDAQPCGLAGGLEGGVERGKRELGKWGHGPIPDPYLI